MDIDGSPERMESFPVRQLVISFAMWILPPVIGTAIVFYSIPTPKILSIVALLMLVVLVPVSAYILYKIDSYKNNGHVSIWGYR
jgi:membrane protein YdbS with pleckstrin-like domain